jgi:hypothetical protein
MQVKLRLARIALLCAVLCALSISVTATMVAHRSSPNVKTTEASARYCLLCEEAGEECSEWWYHYAQIDMLWNPHASQGGSHSFCVVGTCYDKHPPCTDPGAPAPAQTADFVAQALAQSDVDRLYRILCAGGARLDEGRSAIQVPTCTGAVVAHFPISVELMSELGQRARQR